MTRIFSNLVVAAMGLVMLNGCVVREREKPVVVHEHSTTPVVVEKETVRDHPVSESRVTTETRTVRD